MAVLVVRAKSKAGEEHLETYFSRGFASRSRELCACLSSAPDKTAMLRRLKEYRHGDDSFSCCFKYSCPSGSPTTSASVHRLFEALCF